MSLWRFWFGLSLLAVLTGTPTRQVEAAADFARTMAELGGDDRVEEEDGGVGDDTLEAPRADVTQSPTALALWDALPTLATIVLLLPPEPIRWAAASDRPGHPAPLGRQLAWLQRFLF